ncbi:MAG: TetR/AcrR family transcriptional regulator [Firmicutes bacterium]|nr:TetR/AcrR family transcriptional regulator [Bacillota bacterium]
MPDSRNKEDPRIIKTRSALVSALSALLTREKFSRITVYDICSEALVSRTAFYIHFSDKYDLLRYWLKMLRASCHDFKRDHTEQEFEEMLSGFFRDNWRLLANILDNDDAEVYDLVHGSVSFPEFCRGTDEPAGDAPESSMLAGFLAGGLIHLILWNVRNHRNPQEADIRSIVTCVEKVIADLRRCYAEHLANGMQNQV